MKYLQLCIVDRWKWGPEKNIIGVLLSFDLLAALGLHLFRACALVKFYMGTFNCAWFFQHKNLSSVYDRFRYKQKGLNNVLNNRGKNVNMILWNRQITWTNEWTREWAVFHYGFYHSCWSSVMDCDPCDPECINQIHPSLPKLLFFSVLSQQQR